MYDWSRLLDCSVQAFTLFLIAYSSYKEMSSILADQRPRIWAQMRGEGGSCGVSANEYSWAHGALINFGDLTPYLTYACTSF